MALLLTEEQTMLRDSARGFLADHAPVAALRQLRDAGDEAGFSLPLWQKFAEMGFTGILVPEAQGGLGLGHVEAGVVMEQIGHHLTASPLLASGIVAVTALRVSATPEQQALWLPALAAGERIAALAVDEAPKHRGTAGALAARREGGAWTLQGEKVFVLDGHAADAWIVATSSEQGALLFLLPRDTPGVEIERVAMVDARPTARLRFAGVRVPDSALLGAGQGEAALQAALDAGRAAAAAEMVGLADEVFERTLAYLKERRQFGRLIGEFQALQHRMAQLYIDIELARAATLKAQQALDEGSADASRAVLVAKARAGSSATLAVQEGVQLHGGMGMTDAFDFGLFMKRARVLQELFGDANFHADRLAVSRGY
jgi:alkylation response protein AidB-like acyl-CoA dehydrogenase